jgi:hypothetical protein
MANIDPAVEHLVTDSGAIDATPTTMWDLTVDGAHSFFVGQGAVLVHNCGGGLPPDTVIVHGGSSIPGEPGFSAM